MADVRRLVRKDRTAGTITVIRDYENASTYRSIRDTWSVVAAPRNPTLAKSQRRYGGARTTGETHDNASIEWKILVNGATADACTANVEAMLGDLETLPATVDDLFVEWKPDGSTASTYYEVRGPGSYQSNYQWIVFLGTRVIEFTVKIPVAPLAHLTASNIAIGSTTIPATVALASAVTGNAPALADISLTTSGGTAPPIWALIGWTKRPGTPLASSVAPWGIIEAETGTNLVGWASAANAVYRGGNALTIAPAGAGSASAMFAVDPSVMQPDEFTPGEFQCEVWARVQIPASIVSLKFILSLQPFAGTAFGGEQFSAEFGAAGRLVPVTTSGGLRMVKLGTLSLPIDTAAPLKWNLKVTAAYSGGAGNVMALDYLVLVPARQRAVSPSGKPNDSSYPDFIGSTAATTKTIRSDLSGRVASGAGNPGRDSGLGGALIELPPGNVDLMIKLSSLVADDPTVDATSEQISHTGVTGSVRVTPRVWLAG